MTSLFVLQVSNGSSYPHMLEVSIFYTWYIIFLKKKKLLKAFLQQHQHFVTPYSTSLLPQSISVTVSQALSPLLGPLPFTLGAICRQRSPRVGGGSERSATGTP